jgi:hypothetical protein
MDFNSHSLVAQASSPASSPGVSPGGRALVHEAIGISKH